MSVLVLDIETIRDERVWTPPAAQPDAFPPPFAHHPICIGAVLLERVPGENYFRTTRVGVLEAGPELGLELRELDVLDRFVEFVHERRPDIVTWNGRRFDLPVLMLRSMRHAVAQGWYFGGKGMRYRYSEEGHCDLADHMSDFGACPALALDGMAKLIGLPGKYGDIDGAGVAQAYAAGRIAEIGSYCMADAAQTAFLWLRWQQLTGRILVEDYQRSARSLLQACAATGRLDELVRLCDRRVLLLEGISGDFKSAQAEQPAGTAADTVAT